MADRRMGDRRTPDKGAIVIKFKDAVICIVVSIIIIISVSTNIILLNRNKQYRDVLESYYYGDNYDENLDVDEYDDYDYEYEDEYVDEELDDTEQE